MSRRVLQIFCLGILLISVQSELSAQEENLDAKMLLENGLYHERYTGDLAKAAEFYRAAIGHKWVDERTRTRAQLGLATCLDQEGKSLSAITHIETALKNRPMDIALLLSQRRDREYTYYDPYATASIAKQSPRANALEKKLKGLIIDTIEFKNTPVSKILEFLAIEGKRVDPAGKGMFLENTLERVWKPHTSTLVDDQDDAVLHGYLEPPAEPDPVEPEPILSIDLSDVSVYHALRHVCRQANLKFHVADNSVVLLGPNVEYDMLELRFFPVEPGLFSGAEDRDKEFDFKRQFEEMGVEFPLMAYGSQSSISYDIGTNQLVVRNTAKNLALMEEIIKNQSIDDVAVNLSVTLWEVDIPNAKLSRVPSPRLQGIIDSLPVDKRRRLGDLTCHVVHGSKGAVEEVERTKVFGNDSTVRHSLFCLATVKPDKETAELDLDWTFTVHSKGAQAGLPIWSGAVKESVRLWDGKHAVYRLAPARPKMKRGAIILVVNATVVNPAGWPIHKASPPKGSWLELDEALSLTQKKQ